MARELKGEGDGWEAAMAHPCRINPAEDNKKHFDRGRTQQ